MSKKIAKLLNQALLENGKISHALYAYELVEHIDYWYAGLKADQDEFVFAVTENRGNVAMLLITKNKTVYVNEEARTKLAEKWPQTYHTNMKQLIPSMAKELAKNILAVTGVKIVSS